MTHSMHALVVESLGTTPTWSVVDRPEPGAGQVRIRVHAAALNFADTLMIEGTYQETPPCPFVPGMEVCGIVDALGEESGRFRTGERIASFCGHGGLAEFVVVSEDRCFSVPDTMDDIAAAAFPIAYGTSHLALTRRARLAAGETLVVLGAAGGVGLTAVEIGKALGARVVAVARGEAKREAAVRAGADVAIDADAPDLRGALKAEGPIHVVYDPVGGAAGEAALRALSPEGRYVVIGFASGDLPSLRPNHLLVKNVDVIGVYWGGYRAFAPGILTDSLAQLTRWHSEGRIRPQITHVLPMARANDGLDLLRRREATGKVVLTP